MRVDYRGTTLDLPDPMHLRPWEEKDEPLASDLHYQEQDRCLAVLRERFGGPRCYVARDRWLLMDPANKDDKLLPDLLVALRVPQALRTEYDPVVEGKPPDLLAEWLSESSHRIDVGAKRERYALLGVREYLAFNPEQRWGQPRMQGWTLHGAGEPTALPLEADGSIRSQVLPVRFAVVAGELEVLSRRLGRPLVRWQAMGIRARRADQAREQEHQARLRAEAARDQAQAAREQAQAAQAAAEAEAARLRLELERLRQEREE